MLSDLTSIDFIILQRDMTIQRQRLAALSVPVVAETDLFLRGDVIAPMIVKYLIKQCTQRLVG